MTDKSVVKRLAIQCGAYESCVADTLILEESMFNKFAQAVIVAYVAEQKPVVWMNDKTPSGIFARDKEGANNFGCDIPLFTLEVKP